MINCSHYAGSISGCRKQITSKAAHQRLLCVRTAGPHGTKLASGGDRTSPVRSCRDTEQLHPSCTTISTLSSSEKALGLMVTQKINLRVALLFTKGYVINILKTKQNQKKHNCLFTCQIQGNFKA